MKTYLQAKSVFARHLGAYWLQLALLLLATGSMVNAQAPLKKVWDKTLGGRNDDQLYAQLATTDGGFLLGGSSNSPIGSEKSQASRAFPDYWVVKIDANGNKVWDKTLGGIFEDDLTSMIATADGGFLLGGYSQSGAGGDKSQDSRGDFDYWVVKIDANGNKVWDKTLGGAHADSLTSIVATADGGFLLGGSSNSGKEGDKTQILVGTNDYWIVKIDASGNKVWDETLGGPGDSRLASMVATTDGGFLLGGYSSSGVGHDKSQPSKGGYDYWVVKIDVNGITDWDKTLGGAGDDNLTSMVATADGGFLLGGYSGSGAGSDKSQDSKGNLDYWVVKIDASGNKVWDKTLGGTYDDELTSMVATADGGFLLGGSYGGADYWVVKIDANGNGVWDKTLGGNIEDELTSMVTTADGGFLLGGYSNSGAGGDKSQDSRGGFDYWVVKLQECQQPTVHLTATSQTLSCAVGSLTLTASAGTDPAAYTYQWNTGATTPSITITQAGEYSVQASTQDGCASRWVSQTITADNTVPTASLTASGQLSCANPSVTLTATPSAGVTYVFSSGATQLGGGSTATVSQPGSYSVVVSNPNGCSATASVVVSGNSTSGTHPDYQALVDLYTSTNGASWTNKTGWLGGCDPCSWYGVSCSGGRVTGLDLHNSKLSGSLPESLGQLANLQVLNLQNNQLSGSLPGSLGNLTNLQQLLLNSNQLSEGLSVSLGNLTNLQTLSLQDNKLSGSLPGSLGNLAKLQVLNLQNNQFSGSIPGSLGNLAKLQQLLLNINQLSDGIPASLSNLTNLEVLNLQYNKLSGPIPASLGSLTNLQQLLLNINQLSGSLPESLGNLTNLYYLLLQDNQLSGSIPGSLGSLTKLQQLTLFNNQLSGGIPGSLGSLTSLRVLLLQKNQLSGCYPASLTALCGVASKDFSGNAGLPGGGSAEAWAAFCASGQGGDGFVPTLTASGELSCANPSVTLTASAGPGFTYAFSEGATQIDGGNTATVTQAGAYSVVLSSPYGCSASASVTVSGNIPTNQTTLYVKPGASGSGASWECATGDLQAAINRATAGQQIWVAAGEYQPAAGQSFSMKEGVKIYGGFAPTGTPAFADRNWVQNVTTLKGNNNHVVYNDHNGLTNAALLDGFTLTGGSAQTGGGMFNDGAYPLINHCVFTANRASQWGGGIYNAGAGTTTVANCLFYQNTAQSGGAAFSNTSATPRFLNVTMVDNTASENGGAVHNYQNAATELTNAIVWANHQAPASRPLFSFESGKTTISNSILEGGESAITGDKTVSEVSGQDPLFVNTAQGDFRLQACSPAINQGRADLISGELLTDLAGNNRIYGGSIDLGAYEYQADIAVGADRLATNGQGTTVNVEAGQTQYIQADACRDMAIIESNGSSALSGNVTLTTWVDSPLQTYNCSPYVQRHYGLVSTADNQTQTAALTLYYTQAEFDAFNAMATLGKLPSGADDIAGKSHLRVYHFPGRPSDGTGPGAYRGGLVTINPEDTHVFWDAGRQRWAVRVTVSGLGGFFVGSVIYPLSAEGVGLTASGELGCANPTVTLTATPSTGFTYAFSSGATQINGGNTASVSQAGTYSVVVTSPNGCSASSSVTVSGNTTASTHPDYQPLVDLYTSTNGANWTNKTGWLRGCDPCSWYGVSCSEGRVTGLDLHNNDLRGSLPASLGSLTNLQTLDLQDNGLSGSLSESLGSLTNLQALNLDDNQLSGSLPASLANLTNLQTLSLQDNELSGSIPGSLGSLTKLQLLALEDNHLTGSIPQNLSSLTNLRELDLQDNQLSGSIPESLGSLTNLRELDLQHNQLSGGIPASLGNLTNLRELDLNNNELSGCYPASLTALCGIATKDFSANAGLPGGGSADALAAFCASGQGGDDFVPTLTASSELSCANPTVTLTASAGPGSTYTFSEGATQINGGNTATVSQAGTYSVVVSSGGCTASASVTVSGSGNCSPAKLSVSHQDANPARSYTIKPNLQLANQGGAPVPYSDITFRYWLTLEDFSPLLNLSVYAAQLGTEKVHMKYVALPTPRQGAFGYVEYSFDASAGTLAGGSNSGPIQSGIAKQDGTYLNESNDYSYGPHSNYTQTDKITVYQKDSLVWGTEPPSASAVQKLAVYSQNRSSASTDTIRTWVKVFNEGNVPVSYEKLTVRYWLTADSPSRLSPLTFLLNYAWLGSANVKGKLVKLDTPREGADSYLELSFDGGLGQLYPLSNSGHIQYRLGKTDGSLFNQGDDFSYQAADSLLANSHMTAYLDGVRVYGSEPALPKGRVGAQEPPSELKVRVLGNPVEGGELVFEVAGAAGQPLRLQLTDLQGHLLQDQQVTAQQDRERYQLSVAGQSAGTLLLRVSTPTQWQTVKVIKAQ